MFGDAAWTFAYSTLGVGGEGSAPAHKGLQGVCSQNAKPCGFAGLCLAKRVFMRFPAEVLRQPGLDLCTKMGLLAFRCAAATPMRQQFFK